MKVYITDKKEFWSLIYNEDGIDVARDVITDDPEGAGFKYNESEERWECDSENYEWWESVFQNMRASAYLVEKLDDMGIDWQDIVWKEVEEITDIDRHEAIKRSVLEDLLRNSTTRRED